VSFERSEIDFEPQGYRKLIGIGEGYLIEELNAQHAKSRILRCDFDNKMRRGTINSCQELSFQLEVIPHKQGYSLGAIKVTYLLDKIFLVFDTYSNDDTTRTIEFVVREIKTGVK